MTSILCLETASTNCSVALSIDGSVTAFKEDNGKRYSHNERLHGYIVDVMEEAGIKLSQLDAVAVSMGPGSYTGLRIGVSAAKGLCFANDIPLIAIPTLEALAHQVSTNGLIVSMMDARRMEVYSAVYSATYQEVRETRAEILEPDSFVEYLEKGETVFAGSGAAKFREICQHPNARFEELLPSARQMAALAQARFDSKDFADVAYFEPYYLKDFIAGG